MTKIEQAKKVIEDQGKKCVFEDEIFCNEQCMYLSKMGRTCSYYVDDEEMLKIANDYLARIEKIRLIKELIK